MSQKNNQSKLQELYNSLTTTEQRRLREGVASPFFNKNNKMKRLYGLVEQYATKDLDTLKQLAHQSLFPGQAYDDLQMRHLLSKLLKLAEEILVTHAYYDDKTQKQLNLMRLYSNKQLNVHYAEADRGFQKLAQNKDAFQLADYEQLYQYVQITESYEDQQLSRRQNSHLQAQSDALDRYYILAKLKQACAAASYQRVFKEQAYDIQLLDELLKLASQRYVDDELIQLFALGLNVINNDAADKDFTALKALLAGKPKAAKAELKDLHTLAQNFCIRKVNAGVEAYFRELFELYQISLHQELILHDPVQFPPAFKNMVSVALRLKEFTWAERFIKHYTRHIEEADREDYLNYNLARVYFEQEAYEQALDHIRLMPFRDLFITLNARMLQIKACIEQGEDGLAESYMDSFKQYLRRRKKLGYHQTNFLNNIRYTRRLIYFNGSKKQREKLLAKIKAEALLTEKRWLLDKLEVV